MSYDAKSFWEERLSSKLDLKATGHRAFSLEYNSWLYKAQTDAIENALSQFKISTKDISFLDVGSGGGYFIHFFQEKGCSPITGIDITQSSVIYLREEYPHLRFHQIDITQPDILRGESFKLILVMSVFYHITSDNNFTSAVDNVCRLLDSKGIILICDLFGRTILPSPKHVRMRGRKEYEGILQKHEINILNIAPIYYLLNRTFLPKIGPFIINTLHLGRMLYSTDCWLRKKNIKKNGNLKLLVGQKA